MSIKNRVNLSTSVVHITGIISILLGALVIAGWHLHITKLIQIKDTYAPMPYNTALSFLLLGLGLISIDLKLP